MSEPNYPRRIVIVCIGNICRSRVGEEYLRQKLEERGYSLQRVKVSSAGVVANKEGRQFTEDIGKKADSIIALDESIEYSLLNSFNQRKEKITTLHILDVYEQDIDGLIQEFNKQLLPYIEKRFPRRKEKRRGLIQTI